MENKPLDARGLQTLWDLIKQKISGLADNKSTIYLDEDEHLSIKGYNEATQGQMLVKDKERGLAWVNPISDTSVQNAVAAAENSMNQAGNYATSAGNFAINAENSAEVAERINQQTMNFVNEKFWWGTLEEYNNLEEIKEGTFYFLQI